MIERLEISDFAVARSVTLEPHPGLNVFTGETGAGKSLIVGALAFAFGARRGRDAIASGAPAATVTVTLHGDDPSTVERTISLSGRSAARIDGRPASLADLAALGEVAVDIHGQSEQLSILRPAVQLAVLDSYAGLTPARDELAGLVRELRQTHRRIEALTTDARERERLVEQLTFEADEIEAAALVVGEEEGLRADGSRLSNVTRLIEDADRALEALAAPAAGQALAALGDLTSRDPSPTDIADLAAMVDSGIDELQRALRRYRDSLETDPAALARVTERLDRLARLRRRYGETTEEILDYAAKARARLATLTGDFASVEALRQRHQQLSDALAALGEKLSAQRREAAGRLCLAIGKELASLGMGGAALAAGFAAEDSPEGIPVHLPDFELVDGAAELVDPGDPVPRAFTESGFDRLEFLASFNPGESPRALASVASGGETSRFLLALATVLGAAAPPRLIVFDEVDEGVGGRAGSLVGSALARLARRHQVFCITHLPQVAAFGDRHFVVTKTTRGSRTTSTIEPVEGESRLKELSAMLGGPTPANLAAARDLLDTARPPAAAVER